MFCMNARTKSDEICMQNGRVGFYDQEGVCLLCGKNSVLKYNPGLTQFLKDQT
jgi:hypothetical protein